MYSSGKLKLGSHNTSYCLIEVVTKASLTFKNNTCWLRFSIICLCSATCQPVRRLSFQWASTKKIQLHLLQKIVTIPSKVSFSCYDITEIFLTLHCTTFTHSPYGSVVTDRQWDVVTDKLCVKIVTGLQCGYWYKICQCDYW
jgi:hypothetical protein